MPIPVISIGNNISEMSNACGRIPTPTARNAAKARRAKGQHCCKRLVVCGLCGRRDDASLSHTPGTLGRPPIYVKTKESNILGRSANRFPATSWTKRSANRCSA